MKRIETYELIEHYLLGRLSPVENTEFETRMKNDAEFAEQVELHRNLQYIVFDSSLLEVKDTLQQIRKNEQLKLKRRKRLYRGLIIVSFCAFILSISLVLLRNKDVAVRPASEAPEASEAFSDTLEPESVSKDNKVIQKVESDTVNTVNNKIKPIIQSEPVTSRQETSVPDEQISNEGNVIKPSIDDTTAEQKLPMDNKEQGFNNRQEETKKPCNLDAGYTLTHSCNNEATGSIQVSITGGTPPYEVALDGFYSGSLSFIGLRPGFYQVEVKDSEGCVKMFETIRIEAKNCPVHDYAFSPYLELWDNIPTESGKSGIIRIYNRPGQLVFQLKFDGSSALTWNGINLKNESLPMGLYPFRIDYDDGSFFEGTVTIKR